MLLVDGCVQPAVVAELIGDTDHLLLRDGHAVPSQYPHDFTVV